MIYSHCGKQQKVKWIDSQIVFYKVAKYKRILVHGWVSELGLSTRTLQAEKERHHQQRARGRHFEETLCFFTSVATTNSLLSDSV